MSPEEQEEWNFTMVPCKCGREVHFQDGTLPSEKCTEVVCIECSELGHPYTVIRIRHPYRKICRGFSSRAELVEMFENILRETEEFYRENPVTGKGD